MNKEYEKERRLLILLSRITFSDTDIKEIEELTKGGVSWCELFKYALHNKVVNLVWGNIEKLNIKHVPKYVKQIMMYSICGQSEQNEIYMSEKNNIVEKLTENNVSVIPVKGAMLVDLLYGSTGIRTLGDLDFLISKDDEKCIDTCMKELGYQKGTYDKKSKSIVPLDRKEDIKWKVGATNVYPYIKVVDMKHMDFIKVDFRHSLDDSLNKEPIKEILDYYNKNGKVNPAHVVLHLAAHMYHEATHDMSLLYNKDINLIKFCDIREYILLCEKELDFQELVSLAEKYDLRNCVYYTFYYLNEIYADGYEKNILNQLSEMNIDEVDRCYDTKKKTYRVWNKCFFERMFASDNYDELDIVQFEDNKSF